MSSRSLSPLRSTSFYWFKLFMLCPFFPEQHSTASLFQITAQIHQTYPLMSEPQQYMWFESHTQTHTSETPQAQMQVAICHVCSAINQIGLNSSQQAVSPVVISIMKICFSLGKVPFPKGIQKNANQLQIFIIQSELLHFNVTF